MEISIRGGGQTRSAFFFIFLYPKFIQKCILKNPKGPPFGYFGKIFKFSKKSPIMVYYSKKIKYYFPFFRGGGSDSMEISILFFLNPSLFQYLVFSYQHFSYLLYAHLNIYFLHTLFSRSKNGGSTSHPIPALSSS